MRALDFKPKNRLHVAKGVVADFVKGRKNDRLGMVVFAAKSFTQCPLTLDYGILLNLLAMAATISLLLNSPSRFANTPGTSTRIGVWRAACVSTIVPRSGATNSMWD